MSVEGQSKNSSESQRSEQRSKQKGQLILEYVLLMIIAVSMATLIKNSMIGGTPDDPDNAGVLSKLVYGLANTIAADTPGE